MSWGAVACWKDAGARRVLPVGAVRRREMLVAETMIGNPRS